MLHRLRNLGVVPLIALFAFALAVASGEEKEAKEAKEAPKNPLVGTWELVRIKYGPDADFSDFPKERRRLKLVTETHWSWVEYDTAGPKEAKSGAGGPYTLKDDKWYVSGVLNNGLKIEDIWQRVK